MSDNYNTRFVGKKLVAAAVAGVIALSYAGVTGVANIALADDDLEKLSAKVDETARKYDEAVAERDYVNAEIEKLKVRIRNNEAELPGLQENANTAAVSMYKLSRNQDALIEMILDADSFENALYIVDSCGDIYNNYAEDIRRNQDIQQQLESDKLALDEKKTMADVAVIETEKAYIIVSKK